MDALRMLAMVDDDKAHPADGNKSPQSDDNKPPQPLPPFGWIETKFSQPRNQRQEDRDAQERETRIGELEPLEIANKKRGERDNPDPDWNGPAKQIAKATWEEKGFEYSTTLIEQKIRKAVPDLPTSIVVIRFLRGYRRELQKEPQK